MLGIEDPIVVAAYLACLAASVLCVIYGLIRWNRGDEPVEAADVRWAAHERQVEEE